MEKNFEIKCELNDSKKLKSIIRSLKNYSHSVEKQTDIYYKVNTGRLKLRIINNMFGNLIFYDRKERAKERVSNYIISKTNDYEELDGILRKQFKVLVQVFKKRKIYIKNNIRVHLDTVKDLGRYLEIEIIYDKLSNPKKQMKELIIQLGLDKKDFIKGSYSDLLINRK